MAKTKENIPTLTPLNFKEGKLKSYSQEKSIDVGEFVDKYDPTIFCRTCANVDPCLLPIFKDEGLDYNLHSKIEKYLPIQVTEKDDLPVHICYHCASTLIAWDTLREGCVEAEKKLTLLKRSFKSKEPDEVEEVGELIIDEIDTDDEPLITKKLAPERVEVGEKRDILQEKNDFQGLLEPIDMESERLREEPDLSFSNYQHQFSVYRLLYFEIFSLRIESIYCCNICDVLKKLKMKFLKSLTRLSEKKDGREVLIDEDPVEIPKERVEPVEKRFEPVEKRFEPVKKRFEPVEKRFEPVEKWFEPVEKRFEPVKKRLEPVEKRFEPKSAIVCENCGKVFPSRINYRNHMRTHNRDVELPCRQCGKVFNCRFNLSRHMKVVHEGLKDHVCETCGKRYRSRGEMADHRLTHEEEAEKIVCEDCGRMYVTKASYYSHKKLHREVKPTREKILFRCEECHKTFTTKKSKVEHMLIHTGEKPMNCSICKKDFRTKKGLEQHMTVHSEVKPYDCKHCGKAFGRKDHLTIHVRCHTGEKPYTCEYCGKGFAQLTDLKKHCKIHGKSG